MALRTNVHRFVYSWQQSHEVGTVMTHILQWEKGGPQTWPPAACVYRVFIWYQRCARCYAYVNSFILAVIPWGRYYYYYPYLQTRELMCLTPGPPRWSVVEPGLEPSAQQAPLLRDASGSRADGRRRQRLGFRSHLDPRSSATVLQVWSLTCL